MFHDRLTMQEKQQHS